MEEVDIEEDYNPTEDEVLVEESDDEEAEEGDKITNEVAYLTYMLGSDSDDDMY